MRLLIDKWTDGYLDNTRLKGQCRIVVRRWHAVAPVTDMYFTPSIDWRRALSYLPEVGLVWLWRKAFSRLRERSRNRKYLSCGVGAIDEGSSFTVGQPVIFLAPAHARCVERVTLDEALVRPLESVELLDQTPCDVIVFSEAKEGAQLSPTLQRHVGWSEFSGTPLDPSEIGEILQEATRQLVKTDISSCRLLSLKPPSPIRERHETQASVAGGRLQAVLWGYGHHAKTVIIPNLNRRIQAAKVHEVDPTQMGKWDSFPFACDTSPVPRDGEQFDVYLIAGFHHTHAPIAVHALKTGAWAVVEKPLATTFQQLEDLIDALKESPTKLFAGFQKRYSPLNQLALEDLKVSDGEPVSYHAIVYEVKLPRLHWYRWPNSGSAIISNGCHWIDHFLFFNRFSAPVRHDVSEASNGDILLWIELENGASFSLALTHQGSPRTGLQEHIQLGAGDVTVRIHNSSSYVAEDSRRVLRRTKASKASPYLTMYRRISQRIAEGQLGDSLESVGRSASVVLLLEEKLMANRSRAAI